MADGSPEAGSLERERICAALLELTAERGYLAIDLDDVLRRAAVDRAAFDRHFKSLEDCFASVWDEVDEELQRCMAAAYEQEKEWQDGLREALSAGLRYLAGDERRARLYVLEAMYVDELLRERLHAALGRLSTMIDLGRDGRRDGERAPVHVADAISGAIFQRVRELVYSGQGDELGAEVPQLMYFAVTPYRGTAAGEAELHRP